VGRIRLVAWLGVAAVVFVAVACSASDSDVSSGSPGSSGPPSTGTTVPIGGSMMTTTPAEQLVTADTLVGQTFVSTAVTGHELVAGTTITMSFTESDLSVSAGCNPMRGTYALDGGALLVRDLSSTLMGCEQALMDQDTWIGAFLEGAPKVVATGEGIALSSGDVTIELAGGEGTSAPTLEGVTWVLSSIQSGQTSSNVPVGVEPATLEFADDGNVAVFTGCNTGRTTVVVGDDGFLTFEPMMTTKMSCGPDADGVAATVTSVLDGRVAYSWSGIQLTLANGGTTLIFDPT
jgi:heat shock protein HslJ